MAVLQPGTTPSGYTAGSYSDANTYTLDGANITDDMAGNITSYQTNYSGLGGSQGSGVPSGVIPTPIESIEEIKVNVSNQTSDFNNSSGAQIQMATKRGTNQIHGSAYWYYFDTTVGAANTWSANHTPETVNGVCLWVHAHRFQPSQPVMAALSAARSSPRISWAASGMPSSTMKRCGSPMPPLIPQRALGAVEGWHYPGAECARRVHSRTISIPAPVTVNGVTYPSAICPAGACDPRGIGISPRRL